MTFEQNHKCVASIWKKGNRKSSIIDWLHHVMLQFHALPNAGIIGKDTAAFIFIDM